jgi:hypothetical protein
VVTLANTRDYLNLQLKSEQVAEFKYRPVACCKSDRVVVVQKNISSNAGDAVLFDELRHFFYITNDRDNSTCAARSFAESEPRPGGEPCTGLGLAFRSAGIPVSLFGRGFHLRA